MRIESSRPLDTGPEGVDGHTSTRGWLEALTDALMQRRLLLVAILTALCWLVLWGLYWAVVLGL